MTSFPQMEPVVKGRVDLREVVVVVVGVECMDDRQEEREEEEYEGPLAGGFI